MLAVAIGSFWFSSKHSFENFSSDEHIQKVRSSIEAIENVTDFKISGDSESFKGLDDDSSGRVYFPIYRSLKISFNIFLPQRVQDTYCPSSPSMCGTERFSVHIEYGYDMPVVFISYPIPSGVDIEDCYPSDAVSTIREFLRSKFSGNPDVGFECLGPSPMHVRIFLDRQKVEATPEFQDLSVDKVGYAHFLFSFERISNNYDLLKRFKNKYFRTLSAYYEIIRFRSILLEHHVSLYNGASELIIAPGESNFFNRLIFKFKRHSINAAKIEDILHTLMLNKLTQLDVKRFVQERTDSGILSEDNPFNGLVTRRIKEDFAVPADEIREVVKISEERRLKYIENTAVLISGIAGGIIGAFLTYLLTTTNVERPAPAPSSVQSKAAEALQ